MNSAHTLDRRAFLHFGAIAVGAASLPGRAAAAVAGPEVTTKDCDVLVYGSTAGGIVAENM